MDQEIKEDIETMQLNPFKSGDILLNLVQVRIKHECHPFSILRNPRCI
jgi:hypothetical protein